MLMLLFQLGSNRYAIPVADVVEVAPRVMLENIDRAPDYVAGLFNYRGVLAPVIDLCCMIQGRRCADSFTSRIVMVNFPLIAGGMRTLGLLAEQVTETCELEAEQFWSTGLQIAASPWLNDAAYTGKTLVQKIRVADLLPAPVQDQLFCGGEA